MECCCSTLLVRGYSKARRRTAECRVGQFSVVADDQLPDSVGRDSSTGME